MHIVSQRNDYADAAADDDDDDSNVTYSFEAKFQYNTGNAIRQIWSFLEINLRILAFIDQCLPQFEIDKEVSFFFEIGNIDRVFQENYRRQGSTQTFSLSYIEIYLLITSILKKHLFKVFWTPACITNSVSELMKSIRR